MTNSIQLSNAPYPQISGLVVSGGALTTITVGAGTCRDSTNTFDMTLSAPITLNATYNGINGLDVGALAASTVYSVYLIADSSKFNGVQTIMSLSSALPFLPSGYDIYKRIGWAITDSSAHIMNIYVIGTGNTRYYQFDTPVSVLSAGASTTFANVNLTSAVPLIQTLVDFSYSFTPNALTDKAYFRQPLSTSANGLFAIQSSVAAVLVEGRTSIADNLTLISSVLSPAFQYKVDSASDSLSLSVLGFYDYF